MWSAPELVVIDKSIIKTKSQLLDIYKKAHETTASPLIAEAKKYKTADEFVKAQNEKLYIHGTPTKIEGDLKLNSKALGVQQPESNAVDVLYVTPNTETGIMHSRMYAKQNGVTYTVELKPEARIFDYANPSDRKMIDAKMTATQKKLVKDNLVDGQLSWMATPPVKLVKELGFDGMKQIERKSGESAYSSTFGDATYPTNAESIMLFNKDAFKQVDVAKTKSQLLDIYKKAHETTASPLMAEAKKYKTAEEFVKSQPVIYHGTNEKFSKFDLNKHEGGVVYFTDSLGDFGAENKSGAVGTKNIMERYLKPDLKLGGYDEADKFYTDQLKKDGYDGLKLEKDGSVWYEIYDPNKSLVTKSQLLEIYKKAHGK